MKITMAVAGATLCAASLSAHGATAGEAFSWTGFYAGFTIGAAGRDGDGLADTTYHLDGDTGTFANEWFDSEGYSGGHAGAAGAQVGYVNQTGSLVFGVESDLSFANAQSGYSASYFGTLYSEATPADPESPPYNYNLSEEMTAKSDVEWFGTLRARLGVTPSERLLVYGTGGLAYGSVRNTGGYQWHEYGFWWGGPGDHFFDRSGGFEGSSSDVRWGWALGAGAEYALTDRFSIKGEYLLVDLGSAEHTALSDEDDTESVTWSDSVRFSTLRVGLNYRF
jgi:outer membrane immunogenic protein